jgi:hypothetical protein
MTRKVFEIHPLFEVVFNWLLSHQDEPYLFEMTEKINQIAAFKHLINCTVENNEIIQEALLAGEINYDCFKKLIEQKRGLISGKKYGL